MTGEEAVERIREGLGFRRGLSSALGLRYLQEAQRDLEKGKTLPRFLVRQDQTLLLPEGQHEVNLPTDFNRVDDKGLLHFPSDTNGTTFLKQRDYIDAVNAMEHGPEEGAPMIYSVRASTIDFIIMADKDYTLTWNYFRKDVVPALGAENLWLQKASDWLIGKAGVRIGVVFRDNDAVTGFRALEQEGRSATFGDELIHETEGGPIMLGANL